VPAVPGMQWGSFPSRYIVLTHLYSSFVRKDCYGTYLYLSLIVEVICSMYGYEQM